MKNKEWKTKFNKIFHYSVGVLYSPYKTFRELSEDPKRLHYSLIVIFFVGILYGISAIIGYYNGFQPIYPVPTMAFIGPVCPAEEYYFWMGLLNPLTNLLIIMVFASFAQLIGHMLGGKGTFEDTLALIGFVTIAQIPLFWIPETIIFIVGIDFLIPLIHNIRHIITFLWIFILSAIAIKVCHKLSNIKTLLTTILAYIPMIIIALTYIR